MRYTILCLAASFAATSSLNAAEEAVTQPAVAQPTDIRGNAGSSLARTGEDLTRLPTSLGGAYDAIVNDDADSNTNRLLVTGAISLLGFQARAEIPVAVRYNPGAGQTVSGIGDAEVDGSFSLPLNPTLRLAVGIAASLDTANENAIGLGANLWRPYLAVAIETTAKDLVIARFSYTTDDSDLDIERYELLLRGVHLWDERLFTAVEVAPGWNDGTDRFLFSARAIAGAFIDRNHVASIESTQPFDRDSRDNLGWNLRINYAFQF